MELWNLIAAGSSTQHAQLHASPQAALGQTLPTKGLKGAVATSPREASVQADPDIKATLTRRPNAQVCFLGMGERNFSLKACRQVLHFQLG